MTSRTPLRVAVFVAGVLTVFGLLFGVGRLAGPLDVAVGEEGGHEMEPAHGAGGHGASADDGGAAVVAGDAVVAGLQAAEGGYTLRPTAARTVAGTRPVSFTVTGPDGEPVTAYDVAHERRLHLVAVRRDLTGFQHVHPVLDRGTGRWRTSLDLTPGAWRLLADFTPTGAAQRVLGADLLVAGRFAPRPLGPDTTAARVDGYDVALDGDLVAGAETRLTLRISRGGEPVTDLQPYLGAYGHLVALRDGDLGYLHVHPDGDPGEVPAGPEVAFHTQFPTAGRYRLFLDFRHGGTVRTAAFTVTVAAGDGTTYEGGGHEH